MASPLMHWQIICCFKLRHPLRYSLTGYQVVELRSRNSLSSLTIDEMHLTRQQTFQIISCKSHFNRVSLQKTVYPTTKPLT